MLIYNVLQSLQKLWEGGSEPLFFLFENLQLPPPPPFLQAYHAELYGARYAWIIPGWYNKGWWMTKIEEESLSCTEKQMNETVKGYIACDSVRMSPDNTVTVAGQVPETFIIKTFL